MNYLTALSTHYMQPIKTVKLGEICDRIISGGTPSTERADFWNGNIPWITSADIQDFFTATPKKTITSKAGANVLPAGNIIIVTRVGLGKLLVTDRDLAFSQDSQGLYLKPGMSNRYLAYALGREVQKFKTIGRGATIKGVTREDLVNLEIPLPDLDTQRHIAAVLDRADALRQKDRQLLAYYEQLPQAVFLETFGDEQGIKENYEPINLCEIADIVSGVTKNTKQTGTNYIDVPYMRVANVQDGRIDLSEIKTINVPPSDLQKFRLQRNDILLTEGGDPDKLGRGAVWHDEIADCIHQNHIFRVRPNQHLVNPTFLSFLIGSRYGKRYFLKAAKQTTGIASINMQQLKRFPAIVPLIDVQNQFAHAITEIEQQKKLAMAQLTTSEALFQSLLHKNFGKISYI